MYRQTLYQTSSFKNSFMRVEGKVFLGKMMLQDKVMMQDTGIPEDSQEMAKRINELLQFQSFSNGCWRS